MMRIFWFGAGSVWVVWAIGCGPDGATDDTGTGTSGTGGTTVDTPTGGTFDGVREAARATYRPLGGEPFEASRDLLADGVKLSALAAGAEVPGVHDGEAWVEFAGVPEGTWVRRREGAPDPGLVGVAGSLGFIETTLRDLHVGEVFAGRPEVALADGTATKIRYEVTGMAPLVPGDEFEVYSYNTDAFSGHYPSFDLSDGTSSPFEGATELAGWTLRWEATSSRGRQPLVDPGQGDDLRLTHLAYRPFVAFPVDEEQLDPWTYAGVVTLIESAALTLAPMSAGQTNTASGAFVATAAKTAAVDLRISAFVEAFAARAPVTDVQCSVQAFHEPGDDRPIYGNVPTMGRVDVYSYDLPVDPACWPEACDPDLCPDGCATEFKMPGDRAFDLAYGNPFAGGTEILYATCYDTVTVMHPTAGTSERLFSDITVGGVLADVAAGPLAPALGLVGDIEVAGAPLAVGEVRTGVGATPTITFSPPTLGTPDSYVVYVRTLEDTETIDGGVVGRRTIATYQTEGTSVTLPAGVLEPGSYYTLQIGASFGKQLGAGQPYQHASALARAATGVFTP